MKDATPAVPTTAIARTAVALRQLLIERKSDMSDGAGDIAELESGTPDFAKFIASGVGALAKVYNEDAEAWLKSNDLEKYAF